MKKIYDPILSKKPIKVPDDDDLARVAMRVVQVSKEISELDARISELKASPGYLDCVMKSRKKMVDIAFAAMSLPADDVKAISRAQAQFLERKLVTEELAGLETDKKDKESFVKLLRESLDRLSAQVNKFRGRK